MDFKNIDYKDQTLWEQVAFILVIVGGIHLGLLGLFMISLLGIFGVLIARLIFILIGIAAGYLIYARYINKPKADITP